MFFKDNVIRSIKKNESDPTKIKNFFSKEKCEELIKFRNTISKRLVDREESTKVPFFFEDHDLTKNLKADIEKEVGEFTVKDFEPHFITTRFPLRLHADTGKDPNDIIFKNIVIPLEINYENNSIENKKFSHTIIFKNKWYDKSSIFTTKTNNNYDFIIKDLTGKFVDIVDIFEFKAKIDEVDNDKVVFKNNEFYVDKKFKDYIDSLSKTKRYNQRTDKHIIIKKEFDRHLYDKYMTHQPYEDCSGLELDKAIGWEPGALIYWDRVRIHSSDNFLKNGIKSKTCIALFTSK